MRDNIPKYVYMDGLTSTIDNNNFTLNNYDGIIWFQIFHINLTAACVRASTHIVTYEKYDKYH